MEFIKKYWIWIVAFIVVVIILYFMFRTPTPTTKPAVVVKPSGSTSSNGNVNSVAQIIASLSSLSTSIGGWGLFGGSDENDTGGSDSGIGGINTTDSNGNPTVTDPNATVVRI